MANLQLKKYQSSLVNTSKDGFKDESTYQVNLVRKYVGKLYRFSNVGFHSNVKVKQSKFRGQSSGNVGPILLTDGISATSVE